MPRGFKLIHSILRGLSSPGVAKVIKEGVEFIAPRAGELLISGTERLRQHGLGKIAEKIADAGLRGLAALPNTVETLNTVANVGSAFLEDFVQSEPFNHEPNATFPDPNVAFKAMATLSGDRGIGKGSGMLVFGSDQPFRPESEQLRPPMAAPPIPQESRRRGRAAGRTPQEKDMGVAPHPVNTMTSPNMAGKNTFGYLGWPGAAAEIPNPRYSEAGQYFRATGRGTNIQGAIPAYGIDHPYPRPGVALTDAEKRAINKGRGSDAEKKAAKRKPRKKMAVAI